MRETLRLTGIHLMRTGVVNANMVELNEEARLPYIADLIARKQSGENTTLEDADVAFHQREYERLRAELQMAHGASQSAIGALRVSRRRFRIGIERPNCASGEGA